MERRITAGAAAVLIAAAQLASAQECLHWVPPLLVNSSGNPGADPSIQRVLGVDTMWWKGTQFLLANTGNNLSLWRVSAPLSPIFKGGSAFGAGVFGDRDYNLFNFSVCDGCRWGVASFEQLGAILFDLGIDQQPDFGVQHQYAEATSKGAFTFSHAGSQYLLINGMPGGDPGLPAPANLFLMSGVEPEQLTRLARVDVAGQAITVLGGAKIDNASGTFVYVFDTSLHGHIFKLSGTGQDLVLTYRGSPFMSSMVHSRGFRVDASGSLAAAVWGSNAAVYDLSIGDQPRVLEAWTPSPSVQMTSVAIGYPFVWMGQKGSQANRVYRVDRAGGPEVVDPGFWDPLRSWNAFPFTYDYDGVMSADGSALYLGRYAVMETVSTAQCAAECSVVVSPSSLSVAAAGGATTLSVTIDSGCAWTAWSDESWIEVVDGAARSGSGPVSLEISANSGALRTGAVTVAGRVVTVTQAAGALSVTWTPASPEIGEQAQFALGGVETPIVSVAWDFGGEGCGGFARRTTCIPAAELDCRRASFAYAASGTVNVSIIVTTAAGSLEPVVRPLTVRATGSCEGGCSYAVAPSSAHFLSSGGAGEIAVSTLSTCAWSATTDQAWIRLTGATAGVGSGRITYAVDSNPGAARDGWIVIGGQYFAVVQGDELTTVDFTISNPRPAIGETVTLTVVRGLPVRWSLGGESCDASSPEIDCSTDRDACMEIAWSWAEAGTRTIRLVGVEGTRTRTIEVRAEGSCTPCTAEAEPIPAIVATPNPVRVGDAVLFTDASQGAPTAWRWSVRSGDVELAGSNERSFAFTFAGPGAYDIELTAANCRGAATTSTTVVVLPGEGASPQVVPGAVHGKGLNGTTWRTDLAVFNPTDDPMTVTLEYLADGHRNLTPPPGLEIELLPQATRVLEDVLAQMPYLAGDGLKGSLRATADDAARLRPVVTGRTSNITADGTFGQALPAVDPEAARPGTAMLTGLAEDSRFRTNLGLVNLEDEDADGLVVWVRDAAGARVGSISGLQVMAASGLQLVGVARLAGVSERLDLFSLEVETQGRRVVPYASVVDNRTGDPSLILPSAGMGASVWLPGIAHLDGANGSRWRSDLTVANLGETARTPHVALFPEGSGVPVALDSTLEPGAAYRITDVVAALLGPQAAAKGYLLVSAAPGEQLPVIAARTATGAASGTFGQSIPTFETADLVAAGWRGCIAGISGSARSDTGFRTNLGLINTSETSSASMDLHLYGLDGSEIGTLRGLTLPPGGSSQFSLFPSLGLGGVDVSGSLVVGVRSGGPVAVYASVVDNRTQDPVLVPAALCGAVD